MNRFLGIEPFVFAHQGGAREAPSSTRFAIDVALGLGVGGIELDVHSSADGVLVCCHDPTVDRTTNGAGAIAQLTIAELEALDAAYWFAPGETARRGLPASAYPYRGRAPEDRRFRILRLREALEATRGVVVNLDIKSSTPLVPGYEDRLAEEVRAAGRTAEVIVASFHEHALARFRARAPEIATAAGPATITRFVQTMLTGCTPRIDLGGAVALQVPARVAGLRLVDERFVLSAHRLGLAVHVWTVDEYVEIAELFALGVDAVMTDRPSVGLEALASSRPTTARR